MLILMDFTKRKFRNRCKMIQKNTFIEMEKIGGKYIMKKVAMISQTMGGKTKQEILQTREKAVAALSKKEYEVLNTYFNDSEQDLKEKGFNNVPLYYLAKSLEEMSKCDAVYFCKGWKNARGCKIEHKTAKAYGLNIIYE